MKLIDYLKDKVLEIILLCISLLFLISFFFAFNINKDMTIFIITVLTLIYIMVILIDYFRKRNYYKELDKILNGLDQKYLINEIIKSPDFLEGKIFYETLYTINKQMCEEINDYKLSTEEFREYLELWCHEIKTPVATSELIINNNKSDVTSSIKEEIDKIDYYIEQVLYYARMENANKDYIITKIDINNVVKEVIKKNKKDIISKKIKINIDTLYEVNSDSKWIAFIINQIITNSIKYSKDKDAIINIYMKENKNNKVLYIEDNGIGIKDNEIDKVFDKGFTGTNGRLKYNSTGIGLYLCKKLCLKLGHDIMIESSFNRKTKVMIIFPNNSLSNNIK